MSYVIAAPELMTSAATDLSNIGSTLTAAKAAAAAPTTGILAAAEDEVSAAIAALFSAHGRGFQALGAQAAAFHEQFVQRSALRSSVWRPGWRRRRLSQAAT
jgi:hypothetical protein